MIAHLLVSRGVSAETPVAVYDDVSGMRAARALWFLEFFGHSHAQMLDGGYSAWRRDGLPVSTEAVAPKKGVVARRGGSMRRLPPGAMSVTGWDRLPR